MLRTTFISALMLTGCANSAAPNYDSNSNVHCHALAIYFERDAIKDLNAQGKVDPGIFSTVVVSEWYRAKWLKQATKDVETMIVKPLYEQIGLDFDASKNAWIGCSNRATNDPTFESFARVTALKMKNDDWWKGLTR